MANLRTAETLCAFGAVAAFVASLQEPRAEKRRRLRRVAGLAGACGGALGTANATYPRWLRVVEGASTAAALALMVWPEVIDQWVADAGFGAAPEAAPLDEGQPYTPKTTIAGLREGRASGPPCRCRVLNGRPLNG